MKEGFGVIRYCPHFMSAIDTRGNVRSKSTSCQSGPSTGVSFLSSLHVVKCPATGTYAPTHMDALPRAHKVCHVTWTKNLKFKMLNFVAAEIFIMHVIPVFH